MAANFEVLKAAAQCSFISPLSLAQADFMARHFPQVDATCLLLMLMLQYKLEQGDVCLRLPTASSSGGLQLVLNAWQSVSNLQHVQLNQPQYEAQLEFCAQACKFCRRLNPEDIVASLLSSGAACELKDEAQLDLNTLTTPLIINRDRLYFRRYFLYEYTVAQRLQERGALPYYAEKPELMRKALQLLFAQNQASTEINWQQAAAAMAALQRFAIISGGPGTGKTTTVIRLLLLLLALDPTLRQIALCAPTGKAAARMAESIVSQLGAGQSNLPQVAQDLAQLCGCEDDLLARIPRKAQTVHRLLKVRPHQVSIGFSPEHPLPYDIVVVDEVSMVDLSLFNKLLSAIAPQTILILLGDKDQLCSVEAGSVLGDVASCLQAGSRYLNEATAQALSFLCDCSKEQLRLGKLADHALLLQKSHRFAADSGIGRLAALVNDLPPELAINEAQPVRANSKLAKARAQLRATKAQQIAKLCAECEDLTYLRAPQENAALKQFYQDLIDKVVTSDNGYGPFFRYLQEHDFALTDDEAQEAFALLDKFRVLCSNRAGLTGDRNLNRLISSKVQSTVQPPHSSGADFAGRVVLICRNDPLLNVTNGDVGFEAYERLPDGTVGDSLRIFLPGGSEEQVQKISPLYLPDIESGFAMTVHKSQGSEYAQVLFCLSTYFNPVLTKELVYTAVTRAKRHLTLVGTACTEEKDDVLLQACMHLVQRESALAARLYPA